MVIQVEKFTGDDKILKKLFTLIFILTLFGTFSFAAEYESFGKSVIENNNLKQADKNAKTACLLNALRKHFETVTTDKDKIPEITKGFIRFIKSYKILDRYVKDYTVYYHMLVNVDDITVDDLPLFFKKLKQTAIYYIFNKDDNLDLTNMITALFEQNDLSTKYEQDFIFNLPPEPTFDDILNEFAKNNAKYLFIFTTKKLFSTMTSPYTCKAELTTQTYTKDKKFKTFKVIVTKSSLTGEEDCLKNAYLSAFKKALEYVKNNYIELPSINNETHEIQITFINFSNFNSIKRLLQSLDNKRYLEKYKMKSFSLNEAVFDAITPLSIDSFIQKLKLLQKKFGYNIITFGNGQIIIDFSK